MTNKNKIPKNIFLNTEIECDQKYDNIIPNLNNKNNSLKLIQENRGTVQ